jgi:hypothetical protein
MRTDGQIKRTREGYERERDEGRKKVLREEGGKYIP